ncbi:MAG: tetratricopeptide repeat protein [Thermoanaerobaculia bacterium]|nr:tetratricopeptide repeat protein [Thermoanaerobaculia bacterium]
MMRPTCRIDLAARAAALAAAWLVSACGPTPVDPALPPESLRPRDAGAQRQIAAREGEIRRLVDGGASAAELADAVGELGRLYHGYFAVDSNALPQLEAAALCYREAVRLDGEDWRWHYLLGLAELHRRQLAEAVRHFQAAVERNDGHAPLWHRLATAQSELGLVAAAEASWTTALELDRDFAAAHYGLGHLALGRGEPEAAVAHLERAVALQPEAARGHHTLGLAYRDLGDADRAAEHLARGGSTDYRLGDPLTEELGRLPESGEALARLALMAVAAGDTEAAIRMLEQAVERQPESVLARRNLAVALEDAGRPDEAIASYRRLVEIAPDDPAAHLALGRLELAIGQADRAFTHLERAVELAPDWEEAHYTLAAALERAGRWPQALAAYDEVLRLDPEFGNAAVRRAGALVASGRVSEGLGILRGRVAADPDDAVALRSLAVALRTAGRPEEAIDVFERALRRELEPREDAALRLELGRTLALADRPREAAAQLELALSLAPELGEAAYLLGLVRIRAGDLDGAATAFETVLRQRPAFGPARVGLAQTLHQRGDCGSAIRVLEEGARLAPADADLVSVLQRLRQACGAPR